MRGLEKDKQLIFYSRTKVDVLAFTTTMKNNNDIISIYKVTTELPQTNFPGLQAEIQCMCKMLL